MKDWYDWWCLIFEKAKTHLVPEELRERLLQNLKDRGCEIATTPGGAPKDWAHHETIEGGICRGGARLMTDTWMEFELPGLIFKLYAADVEYYLEVLDDLPERLELGVPYYKLHGDLHCICLLPELKDELERLLTARLEEANAIRDVEFQRWNEKIKELAESPYVDPGPPREHRPIKEV